MKGKSNCKLCNGIGSYIEEADAHHSAGQVPCYHDPDLPKPELKKKRLAVPENVFPNPEKYKIVVEASDAIEFNNELAKLIKDNNRMEQALKEIMNTTEDAGTLRHVMRGLGFPV
jgi:hypothetical protein